MKINRARFALYSIDWKMESLDLKLPLLSKLYDSCFLTD